jgi:hypothetical protein
MTAIAPYRVPSFVDTCFSHKHLECLHELPGFSSLSPDESRSLCCLSGMLEAAESLDGIHVAQKVFILHYFDYFKFVLGVMKGYTSIDFSFLFPACKSLGIYDQDGADDWNEFDKLKDSVSIPLLHENQTCLALNARSPVFRVWKSLYRDFRAGTIYPTYLDLFTRKSPLEVINDYRFLILCHILGVCECCLLPVDECLIREQDRPEAKPLVDAAEKALIMQTLAHHADLTKEEGETICLLPDILSRLEPLYVQHDDDDPYHFPCWNVDFVRELFVSYRYLWLILGILEDNLNVDFSVLYADYDNLSIPIEIETDEGDFVDNCFISMLQKFMYESVSRYRDSYRNFLLTGLIDLGPEFRVD